MASILIKHMPPVSAETGGMIIVGPSDRIRTCGILLPKQAPYQLGDTRIREVLYTKPLEKAIIFCDFLGRPGNRSPHFGLFYRSWVTRGKTVAVRRPAVTRDRLAVAAVRSPYSAALLVPMT